MRTSFLNNFIYEYLSHNNLLSPQLSHNQNIDKGNLDIAVFVDHKKAFDTVDHTILLNKLQYSFIGDELKWIQLCPSNRSEQCFINGVLSNTGIMKCGVPQGSTLGTLLFLIFINRKLKQATFLSTRTAAGSKLRRYGWRMIALAVLV